jgi:hypothetical protein
VRIIDNVNNLKLPENSFGTYFLMTAEKVNNTGVKSSTEGHAMKDMVEVIPRTILNINHMPTTGNYFKNIISSFTSKCLWL